MRRAEKQISNQEPMEAVIRESLVCHLAMADGDQPYVVPLNFGYRERTLYFHCAAEGKKIDILRKNPKVCFEMEAGVEIQPGKEACNWGVQYRSVIGFGSVEFVESDEEKTMALHQIMKQYSDLEFTFSEKSMQKTTVFKVVIDSMTGKKSN